MPERIEVPEPDEKGYTTEQIRRIVENYKRRTGTLPYPDPVEVPPLRNTQPSILDRIWANRWNLARHLIIDGLAGAGTAFMSMLVKTGDIGLSGAAAAGGFVLAGVGGAVRKGIDDSRRAQGKADMVSAAFRRRTEGDAMSIRTNVYEVRDKFAAIGIKLTDDVPNKDQMTDLLGDAVGLVTEAVDFKDIPQKERAQAIAHALIGAGNMVLDAQEYSDEGGE